MSGHGYLDMVGYEKFLNKELQDFSLPQSEIDETEARLKSKGFPEAPIRRTGKWTPGNIDHSQYADHGKI